MGEPTGTPARPTGRSSEATHFYDDGVFDRRYGGDLQGVLDRLDYMRWTSASTSLYFNPVFYARSLHKYDGNTFHHVDPHFGPDPEGDFELDGDRDQRSGQDLEDGPAADRLFYETWSSSAHERGMRVVLDGVFNHTGIGTSSRLRTWPRSCRPRTRRTAIGTSSPRTTTRTTPANEFNYKGVVGRR